MNSVSKYIPNTITCINLVGGCLSIICATKGGQPLWGLRGFEWAYIFIGISAIADFFDGFAARILHAKSNLGKELDSLCDLVSFGVAPAIILFFCIEDILSSTWIAWGSLLIPVCGALRLAKFNIDDRQTTTFIGLPIPANAIFWIGFSSFNYYVEPMSQWLILLAVLIISLLMVSPVKMFSLKFSNYRWKDNISR